MSEVFFSRQIDVVALTKEVGWVEYSEPHQNVEDVGGPDSSTIGVPQAQEARTS